MAEPIKVYWQPGCTSCLRTKEFLAARGVEFVSVNVAADAGAREELARLGARSVPVVARGNRFVFAQLLDTVADFLGLDAAGGPKLAPEALVERLALILETARRLTGQIPEARRDDGLPGRDRSFRELAYHVFQIPEVFLAAQAGAELSYEALAEPPPAHLVSLADIADYGAGLAARVAAWWDGEPDRAGARTLATYFGPQSLHVVLERTVWYSAQHTRQLAMVLEGLAVAPDRPLAPAALAGLPLPEEVWDAL